MNTYLFYAVIVLVSTLMIKGACIPYIHCEFYAFFFGIVILNFAANDKIKISLENRFFNYLGKISYGMYMYHTIAVVIGVKISHSFNNSNFISYPISYALTILVSILSYEYFEKPFLKLPT